MAQSGPRDTAAVLGSRYWLTAKGEAAVEQIRTAKTEIDQEKTRP